MRSHQVGWICCFCLDDSKRTGYGIMEHFVCKECCNQRLAEGGEQLLYDDVEEVEHDGGD